jgi:hypothetical protein
VTASTLGRALIRPGSREYREERSRISLSARLRVKLSEQIVALPTFYEARQQTDLFALSPDTEES